MIPVAFDSETFRIEPGRQAPPLVCAAFASDSKTAALLDHRDGPEVYERLLDDGAHIVGHNVSYDNCVMMAHDWRLGHAIIKAYDEDRICDTLYREQLIDIAQGNFRDYGYSLGALSQRLGYNLAKEDDGWRLRYGELYGIPPDAWPHDAREYALDDVRSCHDLWRDQERHADLLHDQFRQARAGMWIQAMRNYGVVTDPGFVSFYEEDTKRRRDAISEEMRRTKVTVRNPKTGKLESQPLLRPDHEKRDGTIEPGSVNQAAFRVLVEEAYRKQGKEPPFTDGKKVKQPDGSFIKVPQVKLDATTLEESGDPYLDRISVRGSLTKILTEEMPILHLGVDHPIHAFYRVLVETGRTGCLDPNLQNRPRRFGAREAFVPRPGWVFAAADFGGLELSTMAQAFLFLLGRSTLAEMINAGIDPHLVIAAEILGIPYDEAKRRRKLAESRGVLDEEIENARQTGKVVNFGCPGGLGAERLVQYAKTQYDVLLTVEQARALKRLWLRLFPEMKRYFQLIDFHVTTHGRIIQLYTDRIRGGVGYTDACNSIYQGLGADVAKLAGWLLFKEQWDPRSVLCGTHTVLFPHDEFYVEVKDDHTAHDACVRLGEVMNEAARQMLPDVKLSAKPLLTRRMSKSAAQMRNSEGRIIPWDIQLAA